MSVKFLTTYFLILVHIYLRGFPYNVSWKVNFFAALVNLSLSVATFARHLKASLFRRPS